MFLKAISSALFFIVLAVFAGALSRIYWEAFMFGWNWFT